jgi:hypothetical protein
VVICEEPLPPNCNQFYGRKCDKFLVRCVFANSSDTGDKQCQCYETYVDCLRKIDRKECMRGAHCKLYDNACKSFYCKKEPIRCPTCYATSEIDIPIKEQSFFFRMVSSPPGMITFLLIFVFLSYQCCMFLNKVIFHGASCKIKTCPFYKHWKKIKTKKKLRRFCKRCRLNLQKYLARVQSKYHQVNGGGDGGSGDGGSGGSVGNGGGGGGGGGDDGDGGGGKKGGDIDDLDDFPFEDQNNHEKNNDFNGSSDEDVVKKKTDNQTKTKQKKRKKKKSKRSCKNNVEELV